MLIPLILSINVHEKVKFLLKQLKNITLFVELDYIIIINCNKFMYKKLINNDTIKNMSNIVLNSKYFDKKRFHGSLTQGIYSNMLYALQNYTFEKFIILSSRTLFYNKLNKNNLNLILKITDGTKYDPNSELSMNKFKSWRWSSMMKTKLFQYFKQDKNNIYINFAHEGLAFDYKNCKTIENFLENNIEIKNNLFNFNDCVEEFALQIICLNLNGYVFNVGDGVKTRKEGKTSCLPKNKFVYKIRRR